MENKNNNHSLSKKPMEEINKERNWQLAIVPLKPLTTIPKKEIVPVGEKAIEQSFYAQPLKVKRPVIAVPKTIKIEPHHNNEILTGVKVNKFGDVTYASYISTTPRVTLGGVRAAPG